MFKLLLATSLLWVVGCGQDPKSNLNRIIGDNDLTPVTLEDYETHHLKSIGRMEIGCTVTHVGRGFAITAGHCTSEWAFQGVKKNAPCADPDFKVSWGVTASNPAGYLTSECVEIVASEYNDVRDYSIIKISPAPAESMPVNLTGSKPARGSRMTIFSHPRKRPMEWSGWCEVAESFPESSGNQFGYTCDTEGGSSGAAVLNDRYEVVGIHNFYNGQADMNGATYLSNTPLAQILSSPMRKVEPRRRVRIAGL